MSEHRRERATADGTDALRVRELESALKEKEAAFRELQHRAKNGLQLVMSLLKLQAGRISDPEARTAYEQTMQRIDALAILYRRLHETSGETDVEFGGYLAELVDAACAGVAGGAADISVEVAADEVEVGLYTAMPLGLMVNELLGVCFAHAYPASGWVRITLERLEGRDARLTIADNGRPLPRGLDDRIDNAMLLVETLAAQIGATLRIEREDGETVTTLAFAG